MTRKPNGTAAPTSTPTIVWCAIYCRVSTAAGLDREVNSITVQQAACEQYILSKADLGWRLLPQTYHDGGFSGATLNRPAFQRVMEDVERGAIDVLIVFKIDRLSRSLLDLLGTIKKLDQAGVAFVAVTQPISTADSVGKLTLGILATMAEFERSLIIERTTAAIAAARYKGKWTGGTTLLGYEVENKRLVVNELEAIGVREAFDLYLEFGSALAVARELNARGRATKRRESKGGAVRKAHAWDKDHVLRTIKNPLYVGMMPCHGELYPSEHVAIIDRTTWDKAQALLADHQGSHERDGARNPDYLLAGLLKCGCCGHAYTPATARKGEKTYRYYRCTTRDDHGKGACPGKPLPAAAVEDFVIARIREAAADADLVADVTTRLRTRIAERQTALETERRELPRAIAALSAQGKQFMDAIADAAPGAKRLLDGRLEEVGARLGEHQARLAVVERELVAVAAAEAEGAWVASALADFGSLWDVMTPENRGRLVRALVHEVVVDEPAGSVTVALADLGAGAGTDPADPGNAEADDEAGEKEIA